MSDENIENNQEESVQTADNGLENIFADDILGFSDVSLNLRAKLGSSKMTIGQFLKITRGSILELDQHKESNLDVEINGYKIAEGEIILNDEDLIGVEIKETYKHKKF